MIGRSKERDTRKKEKEKKEEKELEAVLKTDQFSQVLLCNLKKWPRGKSIATE